MNNTLCGLDGAHELLIKLVDQAPEDWAMRKKVVQVLFDANYFRDASQMIWRAPEIPPVGEDVVFATRIVSKGQPTRAMRLINTVIEKNLCRPEENLAMAKRFMKADMPYQAVRFYGAAVALDAKLIDERFEVSLLKVDAEKLSWRDQVSGEDFPWEGPEVIDESVTQEEKDDAHAALLNGLTQPVPIKSAMYEAKRNAILAEAQEPEPERELPTWRVQKGRATFDPNNIFSDEMAAEATHSTPAEQEVAEQQEEAEEPTAEEAVVDVQAVTDEEEDAFVKMAGEPVAGQSADHEPVAVTEDITEEDTEEESVVDAPAAHVPEQETPQKPTTFFKSYDDAHQHKDEVLQTTSEAEQVAEQVAVPAAEGLPDVSHDNPSPQDDDKGDELADYVAVAMAEYESADKEVGHDEPPERSGGVVGALSSLVGCFRKTKPSEEAECDVQAESEEHETRSGQVEAAAAESRETPLEQVAAVPTPMRVPPVPTAAICVSDDSTETPPADGHPSPLDKPGVHTSAQKLMAAAQPEPEQPRELDGRTQLVALAPEDGTPYFEQLSVKYQNLPQGQVPTAVAVARDMANADYLGLVNQACGKDLDAFSKLLGLHRVMAANHCTDWAEDMNLLRKGYGDAVLATVVSKYSVSECREILNSVYQHPASTAAVV